MPAAKGPEIEQHNEEVGASGQEIKLEGVRYSSGAFEPWLVTVCRTSSAPLVIQHETIELATPYRRMSSCSASETSWESVKPNALAIRNALTRPTLRAPRSTSAT